MFFDNNTDPYTISYIAFAAGVAQANNSLAEYLDKVQQATPSDLVPEWLMNQRKVSLELFCSLASCTRIPGIFAKAQDLGNAALRTRSSGP